MALAARSGVRGIMGATVNCRNHGRKCSVHGPHRLGGRMGLFEGVLKFMKGGEDRTPLEKPGRNDPCWCGSGKKYKKCHLAEDEKKQAKFQSCNCGPT